MTIASLLEFLRLIDYWAHRLVHLAVCLFFFFKPVLVGGALLMALLAWGVAWAVGRVREEPASRPVLAARPRRSPRLADVALVAAVLSLGARSLAGSSRPPS